MIWTNYFYCFFFHVRRHCQNEDSNTVLMKMAWLKRSACLYCCISQLTVTKNGKGVRFCPKSFSFLKEAKIVIPIWLWRQEFFSPGGITSSPLLKSRHYTPCCTPITDQYNSLRIYCLFYTLVWQVLIRTELLNCISQKREKVIKTSQ